MRNFKLKQSRGPSFFDDPAPLAKDNKATWDEKIALGYSTKAKPDAVLFQILIGGLKTGFDTTSGYPTEEEADPISLLGDDTGTISEDTENILRNISEKIEALTIEEKYALVGVEYKRTYKEVLALTEEERIFRYYVCKICWPEIKEQRILGAYSYNRCCIL